MRSLCLALTMFLMACEGEDLSSPADARVITAIDGALDAAPLDAAAPDDVAETDAKADATPLDAPESDAEALDAPDPDAAALDAPAPDAAPLDAPAPDAAPLDASAPDAAPLDAATPDATGPDASVPGLCDPTYLPMNRANPLSCCLNGNDEWFVGGNVPSRLVHRKHGTACTSSLGVPGCVGNGCYFGPCGSVILETFDVPAVVFYPTSDATVCGRQATSLAGVPEPWTSQTTYPGQVTACPFTNCTASGPVVSLTVNVTATAATGTVVSTPAGISLTGAGTRTFAFADPAVSLDATPADAHGRAVFSGACTATGAYGSTATCALTLGPDKTVAVVFECEEGFTCP
jgi:hypothetical protein